MPTPCLCTLPHTLSYTLVRNFPAPYLSRILAYTSTRRSYLRADYAIDCSDTEAWGSYKRVELLAWLGILLYPVGRLQPVEGVVRPLLQQLPVVWAWCVAENALCAKPSSSLPKLAPQSESLDRTTKKSFSPAGTSVLYTFLIIASRRAILDHKPTSLSSALGFLVQSVVRQLEPRRTAHCASTGLLLTLVCRACMVEQ